MGILSLRFVEGFEVAKYRILAELGIIPLSEKIVEMN